LLAAIAALTMVSAVHAAPERTELTFGIGPGDWGTGGLTVIADQNGYFKEEGFSKINLKTFPAGQLQVEALVAGAVDIVNPAQGPVLTLRSNGFPVVVLASLAQYNDAIGCAVRESLGVKDPKQLEGLKLGVLKGTTAEQMIANLAKHYGVDQSKIQLVNLAPPEQLSSLATGAIDGICVWQPWIQLARQKTPIQVIHTGAHSRFAQNSGETVQIDYTRGIVAAAAQFVKKNPKTIDALMHAYVKAQAFVSDPKNYDKVLAIYTKQFNLDPEVYKTIIKEYHGTLALDKSYVDDMNTIQDFLSATGRLKNRVDVLDITYGEPLRSIDPKLVTVDAKWKP
jgi:ABC-type nitrate/sulfonate/bicarbonate transport system substrate-binding protein